MDRKIKITRSDRDGEYYGRYDKSDHNPKSFAKFLEQYDIVAYYIMPENLQQNGMAERRNCTLMDMMRSIVSKCSLSLNLCREALKIAMSILNRISSKAIPKTLFEL